MTTTKQYDLLNRLTRIASVGGTGSTLAAFAYTYNALGRRIRQITSDGGSGTWQVTEDLKLISDPTLFGRHIAELNASDNALVRSYAWGLDLSGTMDGAGGVGGLLWVTSFQVPASSSSYFAAYDGNGNVAALLHAPSSMPHAHYEYGPFGEPIRVSGPAAALNPFRFSTKRVDPTTDLLLYEYRPYRPTLGRWLSRDPIVERGGRNCCAFVQNRPTTLVDVYGLYGNPICWPEGPIRCDYAKYWWNQCFCTCRAVRITRAPWVEPESQYPQVAIGVRVSVKIEIEGNPGLCKCVHRDRGGVWLGVESPWWSSVDKDEAIACRDYVDKPGVDQYPPPPAEIPWNDFTEQWRMKYQLTIEVTCQGNIGPLLKDAVSLQEQYDFNVTYGRDRRVRLTPVGP